MTIDHAILHALRISECDIALDSCALILKGELSLDERGGVVASEPVGERSKRIEVVVVVL